MNKLTKNFCNYLVIRLIDGHIYYSLDSKKLNWPSIYSPVSFSYFWESGEYFFPFCNFKATNIFFCTFVFDAVHIKKQASLPATLHSTFSSFKQILFVLLFLCPAIRIFNLIKSKTGWINSGINQLAKSWIILKVNGN